MVGGSMLIRCQARLWPFDVRYGDAAAGTVQELFSALERPPGKDPAVTFALHHGARDIPWSVWRDDELIMGCEQLSDALQGLLIHITQGVVNARSDLLSIHAASVAFDGAGILLPGSSGSGKTTLCARLLQLGADYLSDDSVALDGDVRILAYPKPLSFKWTDAGDRFTELDLSDLDIDPGRQLAWQVAPSRFGARTAGSVICALIIAPRYEPGQQTRIERVSPHEAALGVLGQIQNLPAFGFAEALERIAVIVANSGCYAVTYGDAREAATRVSELIPSSSGSASRFALVRSPGSGSGEAAGVRPASGLTALVFDEGALLLRDDTGETATLDRRGARIWSLLDGTRTVDDIAGLIVSEVMDEPVDEDRRLGALIRSDVAAWIDQLVDLGFVHRSRAQPRPI